MQADNKDAGTGKKPKYGDKKKNAKNGQGDDAGKNFCAVVVATVIFCVTQELIVTSRRPKVL